MPDRLLDVRFQASIGIHRYNAAEFERIGKEETLPLPVNRVVQAAHNLFATGFLDRRCGNAATSALGFQRRIERPTRPVLVPYGSTSLTLC